MAKHLGKIVDNSSAKDISDALLNVGLAYAGYEVLINREGKRNWKSTLFGPVSLKLAQSPNVAAGTAGVLGLATLGLASIADIKEGILNELFLNQIKSHLKESVNITKEQQRFHEVTRGGF